MIYGDLPRGLQSLCPSGTLALPELMRNFIPAGWERMSDVQKDRCLRLLRKERDPIKCSMNAVRYASAALLS